MLGQLRRPGDRLFDLRRGRADARRDRPTHRLRRHRRQPGADVDDDDARGAAYLFVEPPGGWVSATETARLLAADGEKYDFLGAAVAVSGATVFAGAPFADLIERGPDFEPTVYVFDVAQATVDVPALTPAGIAALALLLSIAAFRALDKRSA